MNNKNCQLCKNYKDGYCKELELKPSYPEKGCDYFIIQNRLKKDAMLDKIKKEIKDNAFDWQEIDGEHDSFMVVCLDDVLQIFSKYMEESEVANK